MRVLLIHTGDLSGSVEFVGEMCAARHAYLESAGCDVIISNDDSVVAHTDHERRTEPSGAAGAAEQRVSGLFDQAGGTFVRSWTDTRASAIWMRAFARKQARVAP